MKFNQVILESLQQATLKRVRIKVDPANVTVTANLANCDGYEGYVLSECGDAVKVLVISPDQDNTMSVIDIPSEYIQNINPNLEEVKQFLISSLNLQEDDPLLQQIITSSSIDDVEAFLKDNGMTAEDISNLYKYYISNE